MRSNACWPKRRASSPRAAPPPMRCDSRCATAASSPPGTTSAARCRSATPGNGCCWCASSCSARRPPAAATAIELAIDTVCEYVPPPSGWLPDPRAQTEDRLRLLDRLAARLGSDKVCTLAPRAEHRPEHAWTSAGAVDRSPVNRGQTPFINRGQTPFIAAAGNPGACHAEQGSLSGPIAACPSAPGVAASAAARADHPRRQPHVHTTAR